MNTNFTLEDIISALKLVGSDGRADELAAEILGVSADKLLEIESVDNPIKYATYTNVWENGFRITTNCKVNMLTKEVFDIEVSSIDIDEILEDEYITIDCEDYDVSNNENETEYWYR